MRGPAGKAGGNLTKLRKCKRVEEGWASSGCGWVSRQGPGLRETGNEGFGPPSKRNGQHRWVYPWSGRMIGICLICIL